MRLFRALLRLLPAWFRREYGPRMEEVFRAERGAARRRGIAARLGLWRRTVWDVCRTAVSLRLRGAEREERTNQGREDGTMGRFMDDLRAALRSLRRSPLFTALAVITLALGIGANAALFGVVRGVVLRPLPYDDPGSLVMVWSRWVNFDKTWVSVPELVNYAQRNRSFRSLAGYSTGEYAFTDPEAPELVKGAITTHNLFRVLGVDPLHGRDFTEEEARSGETVIVVGHRLWSRRWEADPGAVGRTVQLNGGPARIVGVLPADFVLPPDYRELAETEVFQAAFLDTSTPAQLPPNGGSHGLQVVGRLADGATPESARADLRRIVAEAEGEGVYPEEWRFDVLVEPVRDEALGTTEQALWILLGGVTLVLLIACGNVANLLLARSGERTRELAVRAAVGAGRGRLLRILTLENLLLALAGGAAGWAGAVVGVRGMLSVAPGSVPRTGSVSMDGTVLVYTFGLALLTTLVFGLVPARRASRADLREVMGDGVRRAGDRDGLRTQGVLVAVQAALATVVLVSAGLMGRTYQNLSAVDPGFRAEDALTLRLSLPSTRYDSVPRVAAFYDGLLADVRALPDVRSAALVRVLPLAAEMGDAGVAVEGYAPAPGETPAADWQVVSEGYFETMGIPVVAGRAFDAADGPDEDLLVVNETMAERYWDGRDPVGSRVVAMSDTTTVIGVVADLPHNDLTAAPKPKFYRLQRQVPQGWVSPVRSMTLVAATGGDPYGPLDPIRALVRERDPTLALSRIQTLDEVVGRVLGQPRFLALLMGAFGLVAFVLALVGVYGVLTYAAGRRTREIGVRMALGAGRGEVLWGVLRGGLGMVAVGLAVGLACAAAGSRVLGALLYGVEARDPATYAGIAVVFLGVAALAALVPSLRATRVDLTRSLRAE